VHEIPGVHNNDNENDNTIVETYETEANNDATHETSDDDDISIELEDHDDNHVTIDDLNIIEQMNTNTDQETGDDASENEWRNVSRHGYNLRPRPTCANSKYALAQDGQQSTQIKMAKPHAHIMMMQMNVKQGIKAFGERGSDTMLKELNQLHELKALLPLRKEDMSYEQRKKALRYLMFMKENVMVQSRQEDARMVDHNGSTLRNLILAHPQYL